MKANDLIKNEFYEWTIGASYMTVQYIGRSKDFPEIKPSSSIGKGYLFQFSNGKYVELSKSEIERGTIDHEIQEFKRGSKIKSHIYKRGTKIEKLSFEKIKQNIDNAYPTDAKQIKNQIDGVEREGFITIGKKLDLYNYWHKKFGETIDESIKNEKQHELDIAEYEFESSKNKIAKIDMNKLSVEQLNADYPYKNASWVWDNWTEEQRFHFLTDHDKKMSLEIANDLKQEPYENLSKQIKRLIENHISHGRYEHGAKLHTHEYEIIVDKLSKNASINEIKTTTYGVDIIPYNSENDVYTLPIKLTIHELISLIIKSMKNENISNDLIKNELCERVKILLNE